MLKKKQTDPYTEAFRK